MDYLACSECRSRKLRCSKARPSCTFCVNHNTTHVDSLEQRARCLERALLEIDPDADLESIASGLPVIVTSPGTRRSSTAWKRDRDGSQDLTRSETTETLPQTPSGFDWREGTCTDAKAADGMAVLSVSPQGVGYLGGLASVALLRALCKSGWRLDADYDQLDKAAQGSCDPGSGLDTTFAVHDFLADQFLDAYFQQFHTAYPIVHEATFRAQYAEIIPRPDSEAWQLLLKTVLAIGAWCTGFRVSEGNTHDPFVVADVIPNSNLLSSGNICTIQALTIMSLHLQRLNRPNIASVHLGAAVRIAMSLGLHKEFPNWKISHHEQEVRRRVWWCLWFLDSGLSITLGRPVLLPDQTTMDVKPPLNVPDTMLTMATAQRPKPVDGPTIYSGLIAGTGFQMLFNPIYNRLISNSGITPSESLAYDDEISEWQNSLPCYFQESVTPQYSFQWLRLSRYRLFWRIRGHRMLIFLPNFLLWVGPEGQGHWHGASNDDRLGVLRCLDHAHRNIESLEHFFNHEAASVMGDWYGLYFLIQAGLVTVLAMTRGFEALHERHSTLVKDVETVKGLLNTVAARNGQAQKFANVMNCLVPDSAPAAGGFDLGLDDTDLNNLLADFPGEASFPQVDEWARYLWPALS
ncbi:Fungal specific transcription factor domain-containing protein [Cladophialophora immunda]|nr:Fungal specific transcription factor domain-containing protein [Cladophialophora immunda]